MTRPFLAVGIVLALSFGFFSGIPLAGRNIGMIGALAAALFGAVGCIANRVNTVRADRNVRYVTLPYLLLIVTPCLLAAAGAFIRGDADAAQLLTELAETFFYWAILEVSVRFAWEDERPVRFVLSLTCLAMIGNLAYWIISGVPIRFEGLASHRNVIGGAGLYIGLLALVLDMVPWRRSQIYQWLLYGTFLLAVSAIISCGSRTSAICLSAATGLRLILPALRLPPAGLLPLPLAVIAFVFVAPFLYLRLDEFFFFDDLNQAFEDVSGNGVYSGRETKWGDVISASAERPFIGHGYQWKIHFSEKSMHAHNLYLGKLFQSGALGLFGLFLFSLHLVRLVLRTRMPEASLVISFLLLHQCFTINFTMGGIPVGCAQAVMLGALIRMATDSRLMMSARESVSRDLTEMSGRPDGVPDDDYFTEAGSADAGVGGGSRVPGDDRIRLSEDRSRSLATSEGDERP